MNSPSSSIVVGCGNMSFSSEQTSQIGHVRVLCELLVTVCLEIHASLDFECMCVAKSITLISGFGGACVLRNPCLEIRHSSRF